MPQTILLGTFLAKASEVWARVEAPKVFLSLLSLLFWFPHLACPALCQQWLISSPAVIRMDGFFKQ